MIRKLVMLLLVSSAVMTATACNTVRGAGEDLESVANEADKEI